jgi:hypothetical protein
MHSLPAATQATLTGTQFFPNAIAPAVMSALHITFWVSAGLSLVAAVVSWFRGTRYVYEES